MLNRLHLSCVIMVIATTTACERPDVRFPQMSQDRLVLQSLGTAVDDAIDELSGLSGEVDIETSCIRGGTINITGEIHDARNADLIMQMHNCGSEHEPFDRNETAFLTTSGRILRKTSIDSATDWILDELRATNLEISGTVSYQGEIRELEDVCDLSWKMTFTEISIASLAELCGRPASWAIRHDDCNG